MSEMATVSLRQAADSVPPSLTFDLRKGLRANRNSFYSMTPKYAYRSVRDLIRSFRWPKAASADSLFVPRGDHPANSEAVWSQIIQGVTHDDNNWYLSRQYGLSKFPLEHDLNSADGVVSVDIPKEHTNKNYDHMGDLDFYRAADGSTGPSGHLYVPLEGASPMRVLFYDTTLQYIDYSFFDAPGQDHAPWCAVNPLDGNLYTSNFDITSDKPALFVYRIVRETDGTPKDLASLGTFTLWDSSVTQSAISRVQGGVFSSSGHLYLVSDVPPEEGGGIIAFDMVTGRRVARTPIDYQRHMSITVPAPEVPDSAGKVVLAIFSGGASMAVTGKKTISITWEELEGITLWEGDSGRAPSISGQVHVVMNHPNYTPVKAFELLGHPGDLQHLIATKQIPTTLYFKHYGTTSPDDHDNL